MEADRSRALLLDTHIWIWVMAGQRDRVATRAVPAIEEAANLGGVQVAAISVREVAILESKCRARLSTDCLSWVRRALSAHGTRLLPLTAEIAMASANLPPPFHGDSADRMLVATARLHDLALVTQDERITAYGGAGFVAVLPG